jgi:hypothetical protein
MIGLAVADPPAFDLLVQVHTQFAAVGDRFRINLKHLALVVAGSAIDPGMRAEDVLAPRQLTHPAAQGAGLTDTFGDVGRIDPVVACRIERRENKPVHVEERHEKNLGIVHCLSHDSGPRSPHGPKNSSGR